MPCLDSVVRRYALSLDAHRHKLTRLVSRVRVIYGMGYRQPLASRDGFGFLTGLRRLMVSSTRTNTSFARYRSEHPPEQPMNPAVRRYDGDTDQMKPKDGLDHWVDGPVEDLRSEPAPAERPELQIDARDQRLWVVTEKQVLHAAEMCDFGSQRQAGVVKHSNLTGGGMAYVGGELRFIDPSTIAITGSSGRYRIRNADEMSSIERAFVESGYNVWSMGYDQDTNRPNVFCGITDLEWVSR